MGRESIQVDNWFISGAGWGRGLFPDMLSSFCQDPSCLPRGAEHTHPESGFPERAIVYFPWAPRTCYPLLGGECGGSALGACAWAGEGMLLLSKRDLP